MTPVVDGGAGGTQISNSLEAEYNQLIPPSQTPNVQGGTLLSTHMGVYGQDGHYNNEPSPRAGGRMHGSHLDAEVCPTVECDVCGWPCLTRLVRLKCLLDGGGVREGDVVQWLTTIGGGGSLLPFHCLREHFLPPLRCKRI